MQQVIDYVTLGIGSLAGLVVVYGVVLGIKELVRIEWRRMRDRENDRSVALENVRRDLGFNLLLGLEFLIAADVVRSIVRPTLEELAVLGGIVGIRTVLSYFLGKEIERR